ncbi:MAG: type II toxin-antitoxin system HicB family antitoxin [archaeon]|nr:type II toxin-antitoxin system HicB family antitoxin [Candidatus Micrarchaeota archaeon]
MDKKFFLTVVFKEEKKGYSVFCPELGVASQGETFEEAKKNITEAVELYIETAKGIGTIKEVVGQLKQSKEYPEIVATNIPIRLKA